MISFKNIKWKNHLPVVLFVIIISFFYILSTSLEHKQISITNSKDEYNKYMNLFQKNYGVYAIILPDSITFCDENVPIQYFDVYESLDREILVNTYWQSQFLLYLKRANRYFPIIEPILKKNGVPDDFKYLTIAESGLTQVTSPSGAGGFWQFMKPTAEKYNLEINEEVDERFHIEKSTQAACMYLNDMYKKFGSWSLVAAGYNMGEGGLEKQMNNQKVKSYFDLYLNDETARYTYRIIAIKLIFEHPEKFGFNFLPSQLYGQVPIKNVEVDSSITNLPDFALKQGSNYKLLKMFNPWLRQSQLTVSNGKKYSITIPKEDFRNLNDILEESIYALPADTSTLAHD